MVQSERTEIERSTTAAAAHCPQPSEIISSNLTKEKTLKPCPGFIARA